MFTASPMPSLGSVAGGASAAVELQLAVQWQLAGSKLGRSVRAKVRCQNAVTDIHGSMSKVC